VDADNDILLRTVYDELRALAAAMLADQRPGHTLQPTALVNEAYVRLLRQSHIRVDSRAHFVRLAAKVMRQVLVDHARARASQKRGGDRGRVTLDGQDAAADDAGVDILALDDALSTLTALDERKARLVELRVFAGMSLDEAADALGVARSTAALDWRFAKAWLAAQLGPGAGA
jgi:RNA polymerase sigma factor (TIGR02999 family)